AYPDTCVGTDSHTPMVNGLGVVAWGVGGIEAEVAMLGQPISMLVPRVVGFKLTGKLPEGVTATDLVLTITEMLREHGVVGKFVEFYGPGVCAVPLANRATIGNMCPEYVSTVSMFPIDEESINYMRLTGRSEAQIALVETYAKAQGLWHDPNHEPDYSEYIELDLATVVPSIAGPKRPQDRINLADAKTAYEQEQAKIVENLSAAEIASQDSFPASDAPTGTETAEREQKRTVTVKTPAGDTYQLEEGAVVIAAITSCTNTSNPNVMVAAGLVAKKAYALGLRRKPWVKTSLAPGSRVVTDYYERAGLTQYLDAMGFNLVGYGCTTCIG